MQTFDTMEDTDNRSSVNAASLGFKAWNASIPGPHLAEQEEDEADAEPQRIVKHGNELVPSQENDGGGCPQRRHLIARCPVGFLRGHRLQPPGHRLRV